MIVISREFLDLLVPGLVIGEVEDLVVSQLFSFTSPVSDEVIAQLMGKPAHLRTLVLVGMADRYGLAKAVPGTNLIEICAGDDCARLPNWREAQRLVMSLEFSLPIDHPLRVALIPLAERPGSTFAPRGPGERRGGWGGHHD